MDAVSALQAITRTPGCYKTLGWACTCLVGLMELLLMTNALRTYKTIRPSPKNVLWILATVQLSMMLTATLFYVTRPATRSLLLWLLITRDLCFTGWMIWGLVHSPKALRRQFIVPLVLLMLQMAISLGGQEAWRQMERHEVVYTPAQMGFDVRQIAVLRRGEQPPVRLQQTLRKLVTERNATVERLRTALQEKDAVDRALRTTRAELVAERTAHATSATQSQQRLKRVSVGFASYREKQNRIIHQLRRDRDAALEDARQCRIQLDASRN